MRWIDSYSKENMPTMEQISSFVKNDLWDELCTYLQTKFGVMPKIEYSTCSGAPGWNVKYRKSGRALCTLYSDDGFYTCLITIGNREATEAELLLPLFSEIIQTLYHDVTPMNGARWLMIPITTPEILKDAKQLIELRVSHKNK